MADRALLDDRSTADEAAPRQGESLARSAAEQAEQRRLRRSFLAACVSLPYLLLFVWYIAGATASAAGLWPGWPKHELGYYPDQGLGGLFSTLAVMSFWCVPLPLFALVCCAYSIGAGAAVLRQRLVVLLWIVPQALLIIAIPAVLMWAATLT
jgi:hypothetical protein